MGEEGLSQGGFIRNQTRARIGLGHADDPVGFQLAVTISNHDGVTDVDDAVIFIRDRFMPTTAAGKRILYLDMRYIFFGVLQDLTYEEKYTDQDGFVYLLKEYLTVVNTFEAASSQMYGIA